MEPATVEEAGPPPSGVEEVHILWISEGMSCDGDSVSITAGQLPALAWISRTRYLKMKRI